jgi:hypothetical protein
MPNQDSGEDLLLKNESSRDDNVINPASPVG